MGGKAFFMCSGKRRGVRALRKFRDLALSINLVDRTDAMSDITNRIFDKDGVSVVGFANAHAFNLAANNAEFMSALINSDLLLRDGVGVAILLRLMKINPGLNMNGTDYIPKLIDECVVRGYTIFLLGTDAPFNTRAANRICERGGNVGLIDHGFYPIDDYLDKINNNLQDKTMIILAMGMPKQEVLAEKIRYRFDSCHKKLIVVNGGAILDFMGGKVKRCPLIWRRMHLEWLCRLSLEPKRLARRYIVGNICFLWRAILVGALVSFGLWKGSDLKALGD